ncbi:MAG: hypothetical protein R3C59_10470 [Planctomycetaceae bacterium]
MNRRRHLAVLSEHMEYRLILSPTSLLASRVVIDSPADAEPTVDNTKAPTDVREATKPVAERGVARRESPDVQAVNVRKLDVRSTPQETPPVTPSDTRPNQSPVETNPQAGVSSSPESTSSLETPPSTATQESPGGATMASDEVIVPTSDADRTAISDAVVTQVHSETPPPAAPIASEPIASEPEVDSRPQVESEPVRPVANRTTPPEQHRDVDTTSDDSAPAPADVVVVDQTTTTRPQVNTEEPVRPVVTDTTRPETDSDAQTTPDNSTTEPTTAPAEVVAVDRTTTTQPQVITEEPVRPQPTHEADTATDTADASNRIVSKSNADAVTPGTVTVIPEPAQPPVDAADETAVSERPVKIESRPASVEPIQPDPVRNSETTATDAEVDVTEKDERSTNAESPLAADSTEEADRQESTSVAAVMPTAVDADDRDFTTEAIRSALTETSTATTPDKPVVGAATKPIKTPAVRVDDEQSDQTDESDDRKRSVTKTATEPDGSDETAVPVNNVPPALSTNVIREEISDRDQESSLVSTETTLPDVSGEVVASNSLPSSQTVLPMFSATPADPSDDLSLLRGRLTDLSTATGPETTASHTLFGDATRLGLMLATINHAGRHSGSILGFADPGEEARNESGGVATNERRRRSLAGRRTSHPFQRVRRTVNPFETVDERMAISSATVSCDALFADAAMMSILFHEAEQRSSGDSRWQQTSLLGGLAAGGGGLAARRARQLRKKRMNSVRPDPPRPRSDARTLIFAD